MMFLLCGIRAEVEPVPGQDGWYQLTGKHIERWTADIADTLADLRSVDVDIDHFARIKGVHDVDPEIAIHDPRFGDDPEDSFGVYEHAGKMWMLLAVNQPEYALFRFLCPHEAGADAEAEQYDPIENYRVEVKPA